MINKREFNKYMRYIDREFNEKLTEVRKEILYQNLSNLDEPSLERTVIAIFEKYNKNELPTVEAITSIAFNFNMTPGMYQAAQVSNGF